MSSPVKKIAEIDLRGRGVFGVRDAVFDAGAQEIRRRGKKPSGLTRFEVAETGGKIRRIVRHFHVLRRDLLRQGKICCKAEPAVGKIGLCRARERERAPDAGVYLQKTRTSVGCAFELKHRRTRESGFLHERFGKGKKITPRDAFAAARRSAGDRIFTRRWQRLR